MATATKDPLFAVMMSLMSCVPSPRPYPPPWIQTRTGSLFVVVATFGEYTLRKRQSSLPGIKGIFSTAGKDCGQAGPNVVATTVVRFVAGVFGARQRFVPVGGAAYRTLEDEQCQRSEKLCRKGWRIPFPDVQVRSRVVGPFVDTITQIYSQVQRPLFHRLSAPNDSSFYTSQAQCGCC